ncbi:MAG: peptide chain release factor N(5)-glutamine methyltransferase [Deltaproteobacteria bacterium]|nr:peptide chain release factor N(5)-glutamine methyltransferase [Deltaproteobacteria bacterium]
MAEHDVGSVLAAGRSQFMGIELAVAPGALVPREETELIGRAAVDVLAALGSPSPRVVDMCCGAGNLACAIAMHVPSARVWASDITDACVELSRRNVARLGLQDRVSVHQGDLFASLAGLELERTIDVIVCNPPYISTGRLAADRAELLASEPREAFDGGPYGLSIHQRVVKEAKPFLRAGGWLMFEFGLGQERQIELLFARSRSYSGFELRADPASRPRVALARMQPA